MSKNNKILLTIALIALALWYLGRERSKKTTRTSGEYDNESSTTPPGYGEDSREDDYMGEDDEEYDPEDDYDEDDYVFEDSEDPITFTTDDVAANVQTANWSDPTFAANPGQSSGRAASRTSIVTPYSKGRRGSGSVGTLQNKGRRGSGSTGTLQNKGRRNQTTQTGWTFATMLERIFS